MFKDELIELQKKNNPHRDVSHIIAEFKEEIKSWVKNGFCKNDNKVTLDIVSGKIICKNPTIQ